jgi:hypothetical protein
MVMDWCCGRLVLAVTEIEEWRSPGVEGRRLLAVRDMGFGMRVWA